MIFTNLLYKFKKKSGIICLKLFRYVNIKRTIINYLKTKYLLLFNETSYNFSKYFYYTLGDVMGNGALWLGYDGSSVYGTDYSSTKNSIKPSELKKAKEEIKKKEKDSRKYSISTLTVNDDQRKIAESITKNSLDKDKKLALMQLDLVINTQKVAMKKGLSKEIESKINEDATVLIKLGVIKKNTVRSAILIMVDSYL